MEQLGARKKEGKGRESMQIKIKFESIYFKGKSLFLLFFIFIEKRQSILQTVIYNRKFALHTK